MKFLIIIFFIGIAAAEQYTSENDDFDIEKLVKDPAGMKAFVNCFIDNGPCDAVSADFKKDLPEAVKDACAKCTSAQKNLFKRFLEELKKNQIQDYKILQGKFDKDNKFFGPLEAALAKP